MSRIQLLVSDIDGTLVTPEKALTPEAIAAAHRLRAAGVRLTLISSRPPRGMRAQLTGLDIQEPFAAFNGAALCSPDGSRLEGHGLPPAVAVETLDALANAGVEAWVFAEDDWLIADPAGHRVPFERRTVGFDPVVTRELRSAVGGFVGKIVGVSDDHAALAACGERLGAQLGARASVGLSQPYYLDITHPLAMKGHGVKSLCRLIGVTPEQTAVIGDMWNDVSMFDVAGFSVAMGQAPDGVKARADAITASNREEGFAHAIDTLILPRLGEDEVGSERADGG